ncbi:hypothetical protein Pth03_33620 [Planotetraspora thailandica]|uniref:Uncharacterized protein n=1 Tax=Planotetraspora thailandica TaxID=487172 RepID=A0A8J3V007_9ACTN|nr:hypothetical protein [Planotetraspora thailandica]GII54973.1 hypothetical protein Pth03_33620 [Planotetraspora thailandica]
MSTGDGWTGRGQLAVAGVAAVATVIVAVITIWIAGQGDGDNGDNGSPPQSQPTMSVTPSHSATAGEPAPTAHPTVTVTQTAGTPVQIILPSNLSIDVHGDDGGGGDGGTGLITALGGFLVGAGTLVTGYATWLAGRKRAKPGGGPDAGKQD